MRSSEVVVVMLETICESSVRDRLAGIASISLMSQSIGLAEKGDLA